MSKYLIAVLLTLAACGGKQQPPQPPPPPPSEAPPATPSSTPMTPDECTAKGGQVRGDIGDGKIACAETERDLGRVNQGIEGAVCCVPPAAP